MNTQRIAEIKKEIAHYKGLLSKHECDIQTQAWIGQALRDLKSELKKLKQNS